MILKPSYCTENTELPDRFTSTALGSPSGTVSEKFKLFEIDFYEIYDIVNPLCCHFLILQQS